MVENYAVYNDTIFSSTVSGTTYTGINENILCFSVGLSEVENFENNFIVFPNPTRTILNVILSKKENIIITNLLGEIVLQETAEGKVELDVSFISAGIYFVRAGNEVRKFVKE